MPDNDPLVPDPGPRANTGAPPSAPSPGIVLMPHTHWDREWYEPHDVFRLRLVHVLDDVVGRLEADPELRFTLDGQAAAIEDYLAIRPEHTERVRVLVERGQLALGPFLILLDEFCCDGETIVRNLELGIASSERLGGFMPVGYLPDMFGHAAQMPQILRGFGISHAALWRGVPDVVREHGFAWRAPDGSAVRCEYLFDSYGSALDLFAGPGRLGELSSRYRGQTRSWYGEDPVLGMLGSDHSAPWPDLMERVRAHNTALAATGAPALGVATLAEYLADRPSDTDALAALRTVPGELRSHARGNLLPGVFSIRTNLKALMADAELALTRAERLDALYSVEDHRAFFDLAWHRVVESSAHDSITGCGVDETADQVGARLASAAHIGRAVTGRVAAALAQSVPSDAFVVLNTLPWARRVQAEVIVEGDEPPAGAQVLDEHETTLGDETMDSADLVRILRRIHGRELFGQLITDYAWGEGSLRFEVAEVADTPFDLAALTAEITERASVPGTRPWRVVTLAQPRRRLLLDVEVPALGHVAVRPSEAVGVPATTSATERHLANGLLDVVVAGDGTLTLTGSDGTVLHGVGRLVDEGDRGDAYNFAPLAGASALDTPTCVHVAVVAAGPLRAAVEIERRYDVPVRVDPEDRDRRLDETEELHTRMLVEVRAGEPFARLTVTLTNTVREHRLRLHVPLGEPITQSASAGQFAVTRRGRTGEGGWGEFPLPTFPATGFVSAGNAHVLLAKLTEYEVVTPQDGSPRSDDEAGSDEEAGDELALTLVRAVGMMSVNVHPLRDEPAGPQIPVPGAQYVGTEVTTKLAVLARAGGWEAAETAHWAEVFRHDAVVQRGSAPAGGPLPAPVTGPSLEGPAVLSSLRSLRDGDSGVLEARLASVSDTSAAVRFVDPSGAAWRATDLRGHPTGERVNDGVMQVGAWSVRTLRRAAVTSTGVDAGGAADRR
ncbi:MAG: hypothetical protein JJE50_00750 [Actinomycetales bacterium]|nr:hypothetical protein [Actinomycetales bacterium]